MEFKLKSFDSCRACNKKDEKDPILRPCSCEIGIHKSCFEENIKKKEIKVCNECNTPFIKFDINNFKKLIKTTLFYIYMILHIILNIFTIIGFTYKNSKLMDYAFNGNNGIMVLYIFSYSFTIILIICKLVFWSRMINNDAKKILLISNFIFSSIVIGCQILGMLFFFIFFDIVEFNIITFETGFLFILIVLIIGAIIYGLFLIIKFLSEKINNYLFTYSE